MRVVFFGTPDFAVPALRELNANHQVLAVVTMPDRPSGRKLKLAPSPVKSFALNLGLTVYEPETLKKNEAFFAVLSEHEADVFVVAAYGLILPKKILDMPKHGCINVHASLLPKYRGASPIHAAILSGDDRTGITIMQMDTGLDTGGILLQEETSIAPDEDFQSLHNRLTELGASCTIRALGLVESGKATRTPQDGSLSSYSPMIKKSDGKIDFSKTTEQILCQIRAFSLWPGAYVMQQGKPLKIVSARKVSGDFDTSAVPGMILLASQTEGLIVKTGDGALLITELIPSGGKKMPSQDYLRGRKVEAFD